MRWWHWRCASIPGFAWVWGRSGWIRFYRGETAEALERFQLALDLAPGDPLTFLNHLGLAASCSALLRAFPELTVDQVKSGLPFTQSHLERVLEEPESAGLPRG